MYKLEGTFSDCNRKIVYVVIKPKVCCPKPPLKTTEDVWNYAPLVIPPPSPPHKNFSFKKWGKW